MTLYAAFEVVPGLALTSLHTGWERCPLAKAFTITQIILSCEDAILIAALSNLILEFSTLDEVLVDGGSASSS